jgi:hypothetical protein
VRRLATAVYLIVHLSPSPIHYFPPFNVVLFLLMALAFVYAYLSVEVWHYFISKLP